MSGDKKEKEKENRSSLLLIIIIIAAVVIIGLLAVIIVLLNGKKEDKEPEITKRNVVVNSSNVEDIAKELALAEYIEPGYYSVSMTNVWHFDKGDAISKDAFVENKEENTNDVYFDVFLASDESDPILQSPLIPRGAELDNISLDKPLAAGTYDCVMIYHLVDGDQKPISSLRIGFKIIVEN